MSDGQLIESQIVELKKLSFGFYYGIALSKEPLTYTYKDDSEVEHQIEVFFQDFSEDEIILCVSIDTNWSGRFDKSSNLAVYSVKSDGSWTADN